MKLDKNLLIKIESRFAHYRWCFIRKYYEIMKKRAIKLLKKIYDVIFFYENINFFWKIRRIAKLGGIKSLLAKLIYFFIQSINNAFIPLNASFDDKPIFPPKFYRDIYKQITEPHLYEPLEEEKEK